MSRVLFNHGAAPSTPASGKSALYVDSADRRLKQIDDLGVISQLAAGYEKNVIINGGFDVVQRAAVALNNITSPSTTNRVYSADRWGFTVGNTTTPQFQQVDTLGAIEAGSTARYYGLYKQLTNAAKIALTQVVEAASTGQLRGRTVRFQAKMRLLTGSARNVRLGLLNNTGTADAPTAGWISAFNGNGVDPTFGASLALVTPTIAETGTISGSSVLCGLTSSWQRFSGVFVVPTTAKNVMPVVYSDNTFALNDDLLITECGLYDGPEAQDWITTPFALELERCQRFYAKTFAAGVVPAASTTAGKIQWGAGVAGAVAGAWGGWRFPVRMVKTPTVTHFNPAAAGAQVRQISATAGDCTSSSATSITDASCEFTATPGATAVIGSILGVQATAEAEL